MQIIILLIGCLAFSFATPAKADCAEKLAWAKKVISGVKHIDGS